MFNESSQTETLSTAFLRMQAQWDGDEVRHLPGVLRRDCDDDDEEKKDEFKIRKRPLFERLDLDDHGTA